MNSTKIGNLIQVLTTTAIIVGTAKLFGIDVTGDRLNIGIGDSLTGTYATIAGGATNTASAQWSSIGGGSFNAASALASGVGGGYRNTSSGVYSFISGGFWNTNSGTSGYIGGGSNNIVAGDYGTVGGGALNSVTTYGTVAGGWGNTNTSTAGAIGGGVDNSAGAWAAVSGGFENQASGQLSFIGGGEYNNTGSATYGVIAGGNGNSISSSSSTVIGGGTDNSITGGTSLGATIGGGSNNGASARYATVPGGANVSADKFGQQACASGDFATNGDAQASLFVLRTTTTSSATNELFLNGSSARMTLSSGATWTFDVLVSARSSSGNSAGYKFSGVIENVSGAVGFVGSVVKTVLGEDVASWDANVVADTTHGALAIFAGGDANNTVRWVASVHTAEVTY